MARALEAKREGVPIQGVPIRVLGLDPAAAGSTGYGIIESDGRKHRLVHYGALRVPAPRQKQPPGVALGGIHALVCRLMEDFAPQVLAVENVFAALNMRTALRLAEVRGVILLAAQQNGVPVHSYSPREIKASVAGYGHADKRQMQVMVRALLAMAECPEPADAADALAVALCHLQAAESLRRFGILPVNSAKKIRGAGISALPAGLPVSGTTASRILPAR